MQIGKMRHRVTLQTPSAAIADGDGGFTQTWSSLSPSPVWASISTAAEQNMEGLTAGTVQSTATHVVTTRYHAGVTTKTRVVFGTRTFQVNGVSNTDERNKVTVMSCTEDVA